MKIIECLKVSLYFIYLSMKISLEAIAFAFSGDPWLKGASTSCAHSDFSWKKDNPTR